MLDHRRRFVALPVSGGDRLAQGVRRRRCAAPRPGPRPDERAELVRHDAISHQSARGGNDALVAPDRPADRARHPFPDAVRRAAGRRALRPRALSDGAARPAVPRRQAVAVEIRLAPDDACRADHHGEFGDDAVPVRADADRPSQLADHPGGRRHGLCIAQANRDERRAGRAVHGQLSQHFDRRRGVHAGIRGDLRARLDSRPAQRPAFPCLLCRAGGRVAAARRNYQGAVGARRELLRRAVAALHSCPDRARRNNRHCLARDRRRAPDFSGSRSSRSAGSRV